MIDAMIKRVESAKAHQKKRKANALHWLAEMPEGIEEPVFCEDRPEVFRYDVDEWAQSLADSADAEMLAYWRANPDSRYYADASKKVTLREVLLRNVDSYAEHIVDNATEDVELDHFVDRSMKERLEEALKGAFESFKDLESEDHWYVGAELMVYITARELLELLD